MSLGQPERELREKTAQREDQHAVDRGRGRLQDDRMSLRAVTGPALGEPDAGLQYAKKFPESIVIYRPVQSPL